MKNQHEKIKGYRDLTQKEIDLMNKIKEQGENLKELVEELSTYNTVHHRWVSIGQTHLQQGIMALVRSVAKPESF